MPSVLAALLLALTTGGTAPVASDARTLVAGCRAALPETVELSGRIILRNRRGVAQAEYSYDLRRHDGETELEIRDREGAVMGFDRTGPILGTDVTWSDVTLDYLGWENAEFDADADGETVHGQTATVIRLTRGGRVVRVWLDRKTGSLLQAEELDGERTVRRLWGTRLKKFGERWMANVLEVETPGSGHRTKITVETMK